MNERNRQVKNEKIFAYILIIGKKDAYYLHKTGKVGVFIVLFSRQDAKSAKIFTSALHGQKSYA